MVFTAEAMEDYRQLNERLGACRDSEIVVENLLGQRYVGCGSSGRRFRLYGTPGNGLGQYLNGSTIEVFGNAQDATGDTMNDGEIVVHGSCGDATGYAMRGGRILIERDCGYRSGIHMKSYLDKYPIIVIGGQAGSFLGEYQAGGLIVVLGREAEGRLPVGDYCGTGMHGGKIALRSDEAPAGLPRQVLVREAAPDDLAELRPHLEAYCAAFGGSAEALLEQRFYILTPNPEAGYRQLYTYE